MMIDLLTTVEYGGCSAKLAPDLLAAALAGLPAVIDKNLLVDISTHDDAGVYKLTDEIALVQTTDFFTPICSDPFDFGQIAAANALSDVWAMGGTPLTALNIVMFPSTRLPLEALEQMLRGGMDKVTEAGAIIVGGHTIDDYPPKYGLAVTGIVHPQKIITNSGARPGDALILTKPIGTGVIVAGRRIGETADTDYDAAIDSMKLLNRAGGAIMQRYGIRGATDITGFSLLGHGLKMAQAGGVTFTIQSRDVPLLPGAYALADLGCLPGAAFRNLAFVEQRCRFNANLDYNLKMLMCDAQSSGGLLMSVAASHVTAVLDDLHSKGYPQAAYIGDVVEQEKWLIEIR
jgi:selenide,water dikinase